MRRQLGAAPLNYKLHALFGVSCVVGTSRARVVRRARKAGGRVMRGTLLVWLFAAMCLWATVPASAHHTARVHNLCPAWHAQVSRTRNAPTAAYTLHAMGCVRSAAGHWYPAHTHCMRIAYAYTLHATQWQYAAIGRQGCNLTPSGIWVQA